MPRFRYQAKDEFGQTRSGILRAESATAAVHVLARGGLFADSVMPVRSWWDWLFTPIESWFRRRRKSTAISVEPVTSPPPAVEPPDSRDVYVVEDFQEVVAPSPEPAPPPDANRVESAVQDAVKSAGLRPVPDVVETALKKFVLDDLSANEREAWFYFRAIAASTRGETREAFRRAEAGLRMNGDSSRLRVALADLHERNSNHERMFELLDTMPSPREHGRIQMLAARYAWFCDDLDRALSYTQPVFDAYYDLKDGDDAALYMRGLPFVTEAVYFASAIHVLRDDLSSARRLVAETQERMYNVDLTDAMLFLHCKSNGDFGPLLEAREKDDSLAFTGGIVPTQIGVLAAQRIDDPNAAVTSLGQIVLPRQHFPWLNDVLLLAVCQLAARAGNAQQEAKMHADFIARQPLLLEPNQALFFNLLEYQEPLKPHAREARRS